MSDLIYAVDQKRAEGRIGASDAGSILGLDKYRSPLDVWQELRGETVRKPAGEPAEWGQLLEPIVRGVYSARTGRLVVVPENSSLHGDWLRATPDGLVVMNADDELTDGLLQVKTCSAYLADEWDSGKVPPKYEVQGRVEMAVTRTPWVDFACLIGGQRLVITRIERDEKLESNILRDLHEFWSRVQSGIMPEVDASDAWQAWASKRMGGDVVLEATDDDASLLSTYRSMSIRAKQLEDDRKTLRNALLRRLADAGAVKLTRHGAPAATAYKAGAGYDWKGLATELLAGSKAPDKYKREAKTWALRVAGEEE